MTAGGTNALGNVPWNISHPGTSIAWEIGVPDRTAREFRHGNDYFRPYLWDVYPQELPNPLVYTIGTSDPATAWNYVHSNYAGGAVPWDWNVKFSLPAVPRAGDATLTVAVASSNYARLFLYLNGETTSYARVSPPVDGGNALLRQGIHAKYSFVNYSDPVSRLRLGANTFTFRFSGTDGFSSHVMYDYLRLELPAFPPDPPSSGRSITWAGGANAAANTWDIGATNSFAHSSASTAFGKGDAVTFNDAGSNSTGITLAGELVANSVTFTGTKNYTLTGSGSITGPISLFKSGGSTLTIAQANAYSGNTVISGGTVAFANDTANGGGLGTSDVTLENGTLKMYSNGATTSQVSSYWNLDVPSAGTGTLEVDSRCDLRGKLTGSGIFRYKLPTGSVRASIFGDWSSFSGTIDATVSSGTADFRMSLDYNWPGLPAAALMLGPGVTAYYSGNLNQGAGTFVSIGELSGAATATLKGGNIGGRALTYRIGGRGGDATFAGTFAEQASGLTHLIKAGGGVWTLSGNGNLNGDLTVEAGTLVLSGSFANPTERAARIGDSALLVLDGTLTTGSLEIADGGELTGQGALVGTLHNDGLVELSTGSFGISGAVVNNGYCRVKSPATLSSSGPFENSGVLNLSVRRSRSLPESSIPELY